MNRHLTQQIFHNTLTHASQRLSTAKTFTLLDLTEPGGIVTKVST